VTSDLSVCVMCVSVCLCVCVECDCWCRLSQCVHPCILIYVHKNSIFSVCECVCEREREREREAKGELECVRVVDGVG
jgi:hypothetical protein